MILRFLCLTREVLETEGGIELERQTVEILNMYWCNV